MSTVADKSGWVEIGNGVRVAQDDAETLGLRASRAQVAGARLFEFDALPGGFNIESDAQPISPVVVRLPVEPAIPDGFVPVVVVAESPQGPWEPLLTELGPDGSFVEATTPHFSWFRILLAPVIDFVGEARRAFDDATGGFTAGATQPTCEGEDIARQRVDISSSGPDTLMWCVGFENDEVVLRVANNRRYPLQANHSGLTTVDNPTDWSDWSQLSRFGSGGLELLPVRDWVTFHVDEDLAMLGTEFNGVAYGLHQLQVGVETALAILSRFGQTTDAAGRLDALLQSERCAATVADPAAGDIIASCFGLADVARAFGTAAVFIVPLLVVGPLLEFFRSAFNGIGDVVSRRDEYNITITTVDECRPLPGSVEQSGVGAFAVGYEHPERGCSIIRFRGAPETPTIWVTDRDGRAYWEWSTSNSFEYFEPAGLSEFARVGSSVDGLGHVFVNWNPGRLNGVSILVPTTDGFDDAGTLPDDSGVGVFYSSEVIDADNDGIYEIEVAINDCSPSCAEGRVTVTLYAWDGPTYTAVPTQDSEQGPEMVLKAALEAVAARDRAAFEALILPASLPSTQAWLDSWESEFLGSLPADEPYDCQPTGPSRVECWPIDPAIKSGFALMQADDVWWIESTFSTSNGE